MSGTSLRGIIPRGGERAPLLFGEGGYAPLGLPRPHTPPAFEGAQRTSPRSWSTSRARGFGSSVEAFHELLEDVAAVLEVVEHVEAGARRREEHDGEHRGDVFKKLVER